MMRLLAIVLLISGAAEMSQATTGGFYQCFPQHWVKADKVRVSCNDTQIAQHCSPDDQSCRNMSKPGVLLEKDEHGVCLTITNCSYDSWSCKAKSYTNDNEDEENFTVNVTCNQATSTSPSPGPASTLATSGSTSTSAISGPSSTLPFSGNNEPHTESVLDWWLIVPGLIIFGLFIFGLFIFGLWFLYTKVSSFREAIHDFWSNLKHVNCFNKNQDMAGTMELEKVRVNGATGALRVSEATGEIGEMEEMTANGATGEIREREEMAETGEVGDIRAREETEETEKLLLHKQNNT